MAEEYVLVAYNFHNTGEMYHSEEDRGHPFTFRPPGYIWFLAGVFKVAGVEDIKNLRFPNIEEVEKFWKNFYNIIYTSQAILLNLTTIILFLWLSLFLKPVEATILALSFGLNPYLIILTGFLHYEICHMFFYILAGYILTIAYQINSKMKLMTFLAGLTWGIATLIRPTTLILPFFHFIGALFVCRNNFKKLIVINLLFTAGMFLVIFPYTCRNYKLTGQWIPVNAQSKLVLWHATEKHSKNEPNHWNGWKTFYPDGLNIYKSVTKNDDYSISPYLKHNLALEEAYGKKAAENFSAHPEYFFFNTLKNTKAFIWDISSVMIKIFQVKQVQGSEIKIKEWLTSSNPQTFYNNTSVRLFEILLRILTVLTIVGIFFAFLKKDTNFIIITLILACFTVAVGLTSIDLFFYYVKIPFLYLFSGFAIFQISKTKLINNLFGVHFVNISFIIILLFTLIMNFIIFNPS